MTTLQKYPSLLLVPSCATRDSEPDSSLEDSLRENILSITVDLFTSGTVSREIPQMSPMIQVPVTPSAEVVIMPFVLAGRGRNKITSVQYLFGKPDSWHPFLLLFSKH